MLIWKCGNPQYHIISYIRDVRRHKQNKTFSPAAIQWIKPAALNEDQKPFVFPR